MKKLFAIVSTTLLLAGAAQAASIDWSTNGPQVYGPDGALATPGWAVALIYAGAEGLADPLSAADLGGSGVAGNDAVAHIKYIGDGISKTAQKPGAFAGDPYGYVYGVAVLGGQTVDNGDVFYIRAFNSADIASATMYLDIPAGAIAATTDVGSDKFIIESPVGVGGDGWQPIPEPASLALAGLGMAAVALRRRFGRKA
jgi:hypothetical protein